MSENPVDDRPLGTRYRLDQPDGTWWELGWDRPLGTFYAQHYSPVPYDPFTPDEPLAWHGTRPDELPSVEALATRAGLTLPAAVAEQLQSDAEAHPHTVDPPFLHVAYALERALEDRDGIRRTTLPARPVAHALAQLRRDPYLAADDLTSFAHGLGIDAHLACDIVDGTVTELHVDQIAQLCEALRCSPYDLWGARLGRQILDVYGPERWPRYIEPLAEGRAGGMDDTFIRRRVEQQAAEVVKLGEVRPASLPVEVTRFRQTSLLAVDAGGGITRVTDALQPADPSTEYHFAFQRIGEPQTVQVALTSAQFAAGCPAGHDTTPALADLAEELDRADPGTDMFRFVDTETGAEQWLGRNTPFDPWQNWDDPRRYYAGDPTDVLNEIAGDITRPLLLDPREVEHTPEFDGVGLEF